MRVLLRICDSLSKLSCLQQVSIRWWKCVFYSEFVIRYRNWAVCNELAFAAEIEVPVANQFRCRIVQPAANQFPMLIFYNRPPIRNDLNACNNFMYDCVKCGTYRFLKYVWWWMWFQNVNVLICDHWHVRWSDHDRTFDWARTPHMRNGQVVSTFFLYDVYVLK